MTSTTHRETAKHAVVHPHAVKPPVEETPEQKTAHAAEATKAAADKKDAEFKAETDKAPSKAWVRKEMELRSGGNTQAEREQKNP